MHCVPDLTELDLFGWALRSEKSVRLVIFKKVFFIFKVDTVRERKINIRKVLIPWELKNLGSQMKQREI